MNLWFSAVCVVLLTLLNGLRDALPCLCAAVLHECGHMLCCLLLRVPLHNLRPTPFGFSIQYDGSCLSYRFEFLISISGPLGNLLGFFCCFLMPCTRWTALFGSSCLALALFNLLPIRNLDGNNILCSLLYPWLGCFVGARISHYISVVATIFLFGFSALVQLRCGGNLSLLLISVYLLLSLTKFT